MMTKEQYERALSPISGCVDAVLDTDTYNEIDDQFAMAYMLRSTDCIRTRAIYAAPFFNGNSTSPADGMERSYQEILHLLDLMGEGERRAQVFRGSQQYLLDERTPVDSPAARDLAERAMQYTPDAPLYVVTIGAITNVASAILLNPAICDRIVVCWLGGHALHWPDTEEFNMKQDVAAARVVMGSGAPFIQLPCFGVVSAFAISGDELRARLHGKNELCTYLTEHTEDAVRSYVPAGRAFSRVIWDVTAVAWLTGASNGSNRFLRYRHIPAPMPEYDHHYSFNEHRPLITYVYHVDRDALWNDMIEKLTR